MAPKLYFKCSGLSLNCSITKSNHTSELHREEMQINTFAKYIINRKTIHKTCYRCNICIDTYAFLAALSAQILIGSDDKSI